MRSTHAFAALCLSALAGTTAGQIIPRWRAAREAALMAARAEEERREAEARAEEAQARFEELAQKLDGETQAEALSEASRLGILDTIARERPSLRPEAVRRTGIALVMEARRYKLDPLLLAALARVESRFDPYATSPVGAVGLLQLRPPTGRAMVAAAGGKLSHDAELYDIETNIALGARYLAELVKKYPRVEVALLAYNRGPGAAQKVLQGPEADAALAGYPKLVLGEMEKLVRQARRRAEGG